MVIRLPECPTPTLPLHGEGDGVALRSDVSTYARMVSEVEPRAGFGTVWLAPPPPWGGSGWGRAERRQS